MTAHFRNLEALKATIEQEICLAMVDKKGCFGTLLYEAESSHCGECQDCGECAIKHAETRTMQMAKISDQCHKIEKEFGSKAEKEKAPEPEVEKEPVAACDEVDVDALVIKNRKVTIDWVAVINLIVEKKPNNYKYLLMLVKSEIGHLVPKGNVYDYTRRLVDGLKKQGAIDWNGDKKEKIVWTVKK